MAQRTEKEETEFKVVPETLTLCVNNCGVTGNPATNNMCQKCFAATTATSSSSTATTATSSSSTATTAVPSVVDVKISRSARSRSRDNRSGSARLTTKTSTLNSPLNASNKSDYDPEEKKSVNRCSGCRKRVGLTGFRCRCGDIFCSDHRYSDRHDCSYDYKAAGREAIRRENPVVKAAKIVRV